MDHALAGQKTTSFIVRPQQNLQKVIISEPAAVEAPAMPAVQCPVIGHLMCVPPVPALSAHAYAGSAASETTADHQ